MRVGNDAYARSSGWLQLWRAPDPTAAAAPTPAGAKRWLGEVATRLGKIGAVCRKACVHPHVTALVAGEPMRVAAKAVTRRAALSAPERDLPVIL